MAAARSTQAVAPPTPESWREFFSRPEYIRFVSAILTSERTAAEVEALCSWLDLRAGTRVLDLGCGQGRIAIPLAQRGCLVTGLDASAFLLDRAQQQARAEGVILSIVHADMKDLDREAAFDAVINMSSAFGYVEQEQDDVEALHRVYRALVPGGKLLIDTDNRERTLRMGRRVWHELDGMVTWSDRSFDFLSGRWREVIRWRDGTDVRSGEYSQRLYSLTELAAMLRGAGLQVQQTFGDFAGGAYGLESLRMIVIAQRPAVGD